MNMPFHIDRTSAVFWQSVRSLNLPVCDTYARECAISNLRTFASMTSHPVLQARAVAELQKRGIGLAPWSPPTGPGRVA